MNTAEWIGICIVASIMVSLIVWAITYSCCHYSKKMHCNHSFEKVLEVDVIGVHKVAYICKRCGLVKKVDL